MVHFSVVSFISLPEQTPNVSLEVSTVQTRPKTFRERIYIRKGTGTEKIPHPSPLILVTKKKGTIKKIQESKEGTGM